MEVINPILVISAALCSGFTAILTGAQNIVVHNYNNQSNQGEDVTLMCDIPGNINFTYCRWYFTQNGGEERSLTNGTRYTWSCSSPGSGWVRSLISLKNITINDSGIYTCEGMTATSRDKKEMLLTVLGKPEITAHKTNYTAVTGTNVTLECIVKDNGEPITSIEWEYKTYRQWFTVRSSPSHFLAVQVPHLVILNVKKSDLRFYRCLASNRLGRAEGPALFLNVQTTPIIYITVNEYKTKNGTPAVLTVRIDDEMQTSLSVQWEKYEEENQQWFPLENKSRLVWTDAEPSLKIATTLLEDDGKYRVIGKTAYHEVTSSNITLIIYVPVKIKELETRPMFIRQGDTVEIRCLVDGRPEPKVTWKLANGTIIVSSSLKNMEENILIIESVTHLNEGNYTCIANNSFNSDESLITLTVSDFPLFNQPNEDLTGSSLEKYVVPSGSVFVCVAMIALIVVIILIRRKRQKGRTDKPDLEKRSTNGQKDPSPSENIQSGKNHSKFYVDLSGDKMYAQVIRKSRKIIDETKSIRDTNIPQSDTHIDENKSIKDTDASQVYMNINNSYAAVQQRSSTSNSDGCIKEETESENTQVNKTEELNYVELEFSSNAQDENSSLGIRGSPSDTTYTEVVFTR